MQYFTINASDLPRVTGLSFYWSYFGHILTILLFRLVRGLGLFLKILLLQTGQRPRFIFENSSFADWSEAGLEDREGEGGGGGDHSQREEKQAAQLKS